jgi:TPR repeat protein
MPPLDLQQLRARAEQGQPESQFLLSQICRQKRDLDGMHHWLQQASNMGHLDALDVLGHCFEKGVGVARDYLVAMMYYDKAIEQDSIPAAFHKAELLYKSSQANANEDQIRTLLVMAAGSGFVPALRAIGYLAVQQVSSRDMGLKCLHQAAHHGDPGAAFFLAWCLLEGWGGENRESEARYHLQQATKLQFPLAETILQSLQDIQPSQPTDEGMPELNTRFSLFPETRTQDHQTLNSEPAVAMLNGVLNAADRAYLMFLSGPYLKRAKVIDPDSQKDSMLSQVRTSMSTYIPFGLVDIIARHIELKIVYESGETLANSEPMSILYYTAGQFYRPHVDYFDPKLKVSAGLLEDGGQRTASAITYLSAPEKGGGTSFPRLNLSVPAVAGSTLWFRNCFDNGEVDDRSLHAGDPVEQGEKWVVTKWFRQRPTSYLEF